MKFFCACGALINDFLSPAAGLGARFLGSRALLHITSTEAFASASSQGKQRVGRQAARQCVAAAAHNDSHDALAAVSCGMVVALTTTMAWPVATGPPVRLSSDGWYFPQEEKLQVQQQGPARQHVESASVRQHR